MREDTPEPEHAPPRKLVRVHIEDAHYNGWKAVARKNKWSLDFTLRRVIGKAWDDYGRGDALGIDPAADTGPTDDGEEENEINDEDAHWAAHEREQRAAAWSTLHETLMQLGALHADLTMLGRSDLVRLLDPVWDGLGAVRDQLCGSHYDVVMRTTITPVER